MADEVAVHELPALTPVPALAIVPVDDGTATKKATVADVVKGGGAILTDGSAVFTADQSIGGNKLTNGAAAVASNDYPIKSQVEALIAAAVAGAGGGGGGDGFAFTFSTTTTDADPGAGTLRFNSATLGSVSLILVDTTDSVGNDITAWLDRLDDSVGSVKGWLRVGSKSDKTKWALFQLTAVTTASGYRKLVVTGGFGTALPLTTAADTFLSFESMGVIGTLPWSQLAGAIGNLGFSGLKSLTYNGEIATTGATPAVNFTLGDIQKTTLNQNCTPTLTPPASGIGFFTWHVKQDGTGGWTINFGSIAGFPPQPNPGANTDTFYPLFWDGTTWTCLSAATENGQDQQGGDLTDGNVTLTVAGGVEYYLRAGTLGSTARTATLGTSGSPQAPEQIVVHVWAQGFNYVFANGGPLGNTLYTVVAGTRRTVILEWDGVNWLLAGIRRLAA